MNMPPNQMEKPISQYTNYPRNGNKTNEIKLEKKIFFKKIQLTQQPIIWLNAISIILFHIVSIYAFLAYSWRVKLLTVVWGFVVGIGGGLGITAGVHRLWTHRAYKAKLPLQILLLTFYSTTGMNSIYDWVRDHRVHHKFSETDADPHNSKRGFFFAHMGWLMQKKHPEVIRKGKTVDMSDIKNDSLIAFHTKYFLIFKILFCFILPCLVPVLCWNETWVYAIGSQVIVRYMLVLNMTWSVNSFAHIWGTQPYDKRIRPKENLGVAIIALGEGWHNYHHVFPWDYKAAELGNYKFNMTTMLLDFFAKIGWAYDMKTPSSEIIQKTIEKFGDGSYNRASEVLCEENDENKAE